MVNRNLYTLVSVNKNPERAKRIITQVVEEVKDKYNIQHVANCSTKEQLPRILADTQPEILVRQPPGAFCNLEHPFNVYTVSFPLKYIKGVCTHGVLI